MAWDLIAFAACVVGVANIVGYLRARAGRG